MITKLVILISSIGTIRSQAQYPAGIDPKTCPNYPHCSNPLAAIMVAAPQYQPFGVQPQPQAFQSPYQAQQIQYQSQYQQPQQVVPRQPEPQYSPAAQAALDRGEYIGDGDYHGEGIVESLGNEYNRQGPLPVRYTNPPPAPVVEYGPSDNRQYNPVAPVPVSPQYSHTQLFTPAQSPQYNTPAPIQYAAAPVPVQYNPPQTFTPSIQQPFVPQYGTEGPVQYNPKPIAYQVQAYQQPVSAVDYSQQVQPAQVPAGLDPRACPNYPFCH